MQKRCDWKKIFLHESQCFPFCFESEKWIAIVVTNDKISLSRAFGIKPQTMYRNHKQGTGLVRELNPGPLAPEARIIPLDQRADDNNRKSQNKFPRNLFFIGAKAHHELLLHLLYNSDANCKLDISHNDQLFPGLLWRWTCLSSFLTWHHTFLLPLLFNQIKHDGWPFSVYITNFVAKIWKLFAGCKRNISLLLEKVNCGWLNIYLPFSISSYFYQTSQQSQEMHESMRTTRPASYSRLATSPAICCQCQGTMWIRFSVTRSYVVSLSSLSFSNWRALLVKLAIRVGSGWNSSVSVEIIDVQWQNLNLLIWSKRICRWAECKVVWYLGFLH